MTFPPTMFSNPAFRYTCIALVFVYVVTFAGYIGTLLPHGCGR